MIDIQLLFQIIELITRMNSFLSVWYMKTGVVKLYLRELPEPLMTFKLYDEWIQAARLELNAK